MNEPSSSAGLQMHALATKLFPICRSISGDGVRQTLDIIRRDYLPDLSVYEIPSGTQCFDWRVPDEWNIKAAWLKGPDGNKICDFSECNLHVVGYSEPIDERTPFASLNEHLYSLEKQPDAIPYVTSYYQRRWGFCLRHSDRTQLRPGEYHAYIDSTLQPGHLTYADLVIPGETDREIFISAYSCHPSLANNELSGPVVATFLARKIASMPKRRFTYRFVFAPETIGPIMYLSRHIDHLKRHVHAAFNLTCIGDDRGYSYIASRTGRTYTDRVAQHVIKHIAPNHVAYNYLQRGSDERQYGWPGVDLPMVTLMRTKFAVYPEYHTSLDNLSVITPEGLGGGLHVLEKCIEAMEANDTYHTTVLCEPQLGKRGLYTTLGRADPGEAAQLRLDIMAYADGDHDLLDIADIVGRPVWALVPYVHELLKHSLLKPL